MQIIGLSCIKQILLPYKLEPVHMMQLHCARLERGVLGMGVAYPKQERTSPVPLAHTAKLQGIVTFTHMPPPHLSSMGI